MSRGKRAAPDRPAGDHQQDLPLDEPLRAAKRYLETAPEQVQAAFSKWIRPEGFVQVTLGPEAKP